MQRFAQWVALQSLSLTPTHSHIYLSHSLLFPIYLSLSIFFSISLSRLRRVDWGWFGVGWRFHTQYIRRYMSTLAPRMYYIHITANSPRRTRAKPTLLLRVFEHVYLRGVYRCITCILYIVVSMLIFVILMPDTLSRDESFSLRLSISPSFPRGFFSAFFWLSKIFLNSSARRRECLVN